MGPFLRFAVKRHPIVSGAVVLACVAALGLAIGALTDARGLGRAPPERPALEGWMSPRYVGHAWGVPPQVIRQIMELERPNGRPPTLDDVTAEMGITLQELEARIAAASAEHETRRGRDGPGEDQ